MKPLAKVLLAGLVAGAAFAGPNLSWSEQWFRAKFGQPSPSAQARMRAEAANSAWREAGPNVGSVAQAIDEQRFRTKYGRYSPSEEARRNAELANTAYREAPAPAPMQRDGWTREIFRLKYGRDLLAR